MEFPDTLEKTRANQLYYLGCIYAILNEWLRLGKPKTNEIRHDFREWCQTIDWIVQNVFHGAPMMDGHEQAQERTSNASLTFLRLLALEIKEQKGLNKDLTASQVFEIADQAGIAIPGIHEATRNNAESGRKTIGGLMAKLFGREGSVEIEEFSVTRKEIQKPRNDGNGYMPQWIYTFAQSPDPASLRTGAGTSPPTSTQPHGSSEPK